MATLLNNRNQFLGAQTERATNLAATITFTTGNTFTLSAQGNTATPSSITMQATAFNFTSPTYLWYRKIGASGDFNLILDSTAVAVTLSSLTVLGNANFLLDVGAETYVQYKVIISEGSSTTIKREAIAIVQVLRQGSSSVLGVLSNDSALVPTDSSGNNPIFTQASTTFSVYNGTVDDSANWTYTVEYDPVGLAVTSTNSNRTQTVTGNMNTTTAVITFTAARTGYSSIIKKFTLFKVKAGIDSSSYWLTSSVDVLKQSTSKVYSPTSITFSAYKATGNSNPALYPGVFKIYENGSDTAVYTTTANTTESSKTRSPSANTVTSIKAELYLSDGTTKIDEQTIAVITDGNDAIVGTLTNETSVLPANTDGSVISVVGASTTLKIYRGIVDDTANWTISTTLSNVSVNTAETSATQTITGLSADTGSIAFTAKRSGYSDITKTYTITKSKSGAAGSSVTVYSVEPSVQVIIKKIDNTLNPATLDIVAYSTTGATKSLFTTAKLKIYENTTLKADVSVNSTTALYTYTPSATAYQASTIKVEMYNGTTLVDSQTIPILVAASSGININVSNQTVSLPSSIVGIVSSYTGSGTDIVVSEGENVLTYLTNLTGTAGTFTVGTPTLSTGGSITVGNLTGNNTTTAKVGSHSSMAQLVDSVTITYPITYIRFNGAQATENVSQSIIKVKSGASGTRGNVRELLSGYSSWTSGTETAVNVLFTSRYGGVIISDSVTVYDGFGFSQTRAWNGTQWIEIAQFVDGNLLVGGTITSDKLASNFITVGQKIYSTDNKFVIDMVNKYISISV